MNAQLASMFDAVLPPIDCDDYRDRKRIRDFVSQEKSTLIEKLAEIALFSDESSVYELTQRKLEGYLNACYDKDESFKAQVDQLLTYVWHAGQAQ